MAKKAEKSPAKARYDSKHPVITIRMDKDDYDCLMEMREWTGHSWKELLEIALDRVRTDVGNAYEKGHDEGYDEGKAEVMEALREIEFTPTCPRCGFTFGIYVGLEEKD